ncbi:MAG: 50S ribosomal protein L16 [Acetobacteraceae bacterium]|nr:50S ribosomal protein L16 [Acetobacteraceae bacterium]
MLMPKRMKYRRVHRGNMKGQATRGAHVAFGDFGLQALEPCWLESRQIEAARRAITHHLKRGGKVWIRVFPDKVVTAKPAETRMGSGKGAPDHYVCVVRPGKVMFEVAGVREDLAKEALGLAAHKLPIQTRFIVKETVADVADTLPGRGEGVEAGESGSTNEAAGS